MGREGGARALEGKGLDVDGIVASSDASAMGAIEALQACGHRVPHDVAVVGFDDSPGAALCLPRLTSIRQDWAVGGELLAQKVLDKEIGSASCRERVCQYV